MHEIEKSPDYKYITNIRHFMPESPREPVPSEVIKIRDFFGQIIKAATATEDAAFVSGLACRQRINRKPCPGYLTIKRQDVPTKFIYWHCGSCEDGGRLSDWASTYYDLDLNVSYKPEPGEDLLEVLITRDEYQAIISTDVHLYDPDSEKILFGARGSKDGVTLKAWDGDLENLLGFMASDANNEEKLKRRKLVDSAYDKVQGAYDDALDGRDDK